MHTSSTPKFPQINRPPVKLTLLTCQVRPNPEEKKCFDLVTREWSLCLSPTAAQGFSKTPISSQGTSVRGLCPVPHMVLKSCYCRHKNP